jgi:hypothetical protein
MVAIISFPCLNLAGDLRVSALVSGSGCKDIALCRPGNYSAALRQTYRPHLTEQLKMDPHNGCAAFLNCYPATRLPVITGIHYVSSPITISGKSIIPILEHHILDRRG